MKSSVTTKNMTSIPISISRSTGIRPGWKLDWNLGGKPDELLVKIIPDRAEQARRLFGQGQVDGRGRDVIAELVEDRDREDRR
jgi:hypothetical protein